MNSRTQINQILRTPEKKFTINDLVFVGECPPGEEVNRQPNVYLRDDEDVFICTLPEPFSYKETAWPEPTTRHRSESGSPPPPEIDIILNALQAGFNLGVRIGRDQVAAISAILNGGKSL